MEIPFTGSLGEMTLRHQLQDIEKTICWCHELLDCVTGITPSPARSDVEKNPSLGELEDLASRMKALTYSLYERLAAIEQGLSVS